MAKELSVNKNTQEIYEFYKTKLIDPKSLKGKNVLVLELGNITYIDEIKKYAKNVCVIDRAYNCFFGEVFENINTLENQIISFLEKNEMPKFDLAIMNPPYENGLNIKILKEMLKSNKIIYIGPVNEFQKSVIAETNFSIGIDDLYFIEKNEACKIFDISIRNDCGIITITDKNTTNYKKFEYIVKYLKIKRKFFQYKENNYTNFLESKPNKFSLRMFVGCNRDESHNWTVCPTNSEAAYKKDITGHIKFMNFASKNELDNAFNFMDSKLVKAICKLTAGTFTPYMDFSHKITIKKFCKKYDIEGYIDDTHAVKNSEWEIILNTMQEIK